MSRTMEEIQADLDKDPMNYFARMELAAAYLAKGDYDTGMAHTWLAHNSKGPNPWHNNIPGTTTYMWAGRMPETTYELPHRIYQYLSGKPYQVFMSRREAEDAFVAAFNRWYQQQHQNQSESSPPPEEPK